MQEGKKIRFYSFPINNYLRACDTLLCEQLSSCRFFSTIFNLRNLYLCTDVKNIKTDVCAQLFLLKNKNVEKNL